MGSNGFLLQHLSLTTFRNYQTAKINLNFQLIFFIGENGTGKTGLLEAISMASVLKSFRAHSPKDMISWNDKLYTIDLEYRDKDTQHKVHIGYGVESDHLSRSLIFDGKKLDKIADFVGKFQAVVFSPDDISIIDTTPAERRRFFDMLLSSLYPAYLQDLQNYRKMLQIRSMMLRRSDPQKVDETFFNSLDKQIAEAGSRIQQRRQDLFQDFQEPFEKYVNLISEKNEGWLLSYQPSIPEGASQDRYQEELQKNLPRDLNHKHTAVGVHRDQIKIFLKHESKNNLDIRQAASQGQKRTAALALKMAQYAYTKERIKKTPVLLIDDVLNELDVFRRSRFIEFLNEIGQALITTTDLFGMEEFIKKKQENVSVCIYQLKKEGGEVVISEVTAHSSLSIQ